MQGMTSFEATHHIIPVGLTLFEIERQIITEMLALHDGDKREVARILDVSLKTIYNKLAQYG